MRGMRAEMERERGREIRKEVHLPEMRIQAKQKAFREGTPAEKELEQVAMCTSASKNEDQLTLIDFVHEQPVW